MKRKKKKKEKKKREDDYDGESRPRAIAITNTPRTMQNELLVLIFSQPENNLHCRIEEIIVVAVMGSAFFG